MTNWILEYPFNYMFGCTHRYRKSVKILYQFVLWQAWKGSWKRKLEAQPSAFVVVTPKAAISSKAAHGESIGRKTTSEHCGRCSSSSGLPFQLIVASVALCKRLVWMMGKSRVMSLWKNLISIATYSPCNHFLIVSRTAKTFVKRTYK